MRSNAHTKRPTAGRAKRSARAVLTGFALATAIAGGALAAPAEAQGRQCYRWSWDHTMKRFTRPVLDNGMRLRWCSQDNRITEFVVEESHAVILKNYLLRDARSDIRPTHPLGSDVLHVSASFDARPTLGFGWKFKHRTGEGGLTFIPNRLGDHLEIDLWPNGHISGRSWTG